MALYGEVTHTDATACAGEREVQSCDRIARVAGGKDATGAVQIGDVVHDGQAQAAALASGEPAAHRALKNEQLLNEARGALRGAAQLVDQAARGVGRSGASRALARPSVNPASGARI